MPNNKNIVIGIADPPFAKIIFADTRASWVWLLIRLYVAWQWLLAGWGKVTSPAWTGSEAGSALIGFLTASLNKTGGSHPDVAGWYASFIRSVVLPHAIWFSYVIAFGELLVGIALVLGLFTGIAAFFGAFMNMNYLFAGTVSVNPLLALLQLFLVLAWRVAGWIGLDRWALPILGTPWQPRPGRSADRAKEVTEE